MLRFKLKKSLLFFFFLFFMGQLGLQAQILDPVSWKATVTQEGDEATLTIKANIDEGWHLYSQHLPSDEGPIATEITFVESSDFTKQGDVTESKYVTHYDPNFEMDLNYFEGRAVFKQKIKVTSANDFVIKGNVYYMVCDESKCLPPKDVEVEFKVAGVSGGTTGEAAPEENTEETAGEEPPSTDHAEDNNNESSGILDPVKWKFSAEALENNQYKLMLSASIDEHWHVYSQTLESDEGPIATTVNFTLPEGITAEGAVIEDGDKVNEYDPNFEMNLAFFKHDVTFYQIVSVPAGEMPEIVGYIEYMTCDESKCLPPKIIDFFVDLADGTGGEVVVEAVTDTASNAASETSIANRGEKQGLDCYPKQFQDGLDNEEEFSYWGFFILAFVSGLAALLTPCVFPMIPMTVSFFMKDGDNRAKAIRNGILFGGSIIGIYTLIGTVFAVTAGAEAANFLATHWIPNVFFFVIFVIFAFSFFGMFEITLPSWIINKADKQADKGGMLGLFFMAFTTVLVSFSCTGPIVGSILVEASQGAFLKPLIGMFGFSLAFALPFSLFAIFPSWLNNLPQSGGWLNSVKVVLGFLELALGLKFLSIADQTYHWGLLDREVYLAFWIVIFTLLGVYLLGKLKFSHDSDLPFVKVPRLVLAILTFTFVIYLIPGMWGAPLKALSGYLPPMSTHDFDIPGMIRGEDDQPCEEPRFGDMLHLPHGLKGYYEYNQGVACAKSLGKPVFIDFTGHGCVNCREMEANVWSDPDILKLLSEEFVVIALYVDDKTELPEEEWITSKYDGKVKKTIGAINADRQICDFNNNAQPYYILLDNDEEMLNHPHSYDLDIPVFKKFLTDALTLFKQRQAQKELN